MGGWTYWPGGSESVATRSPEKILSASFTMPVRLSVDWRIAETAVIPGARIALRTELVLAGVEVHLFLRTRESNATGSAQGQLHRVSLFPPDTRALRHERRLLHATGASRLAVRVTDAAGSRLSDDVAVGLHDGAWRRSELALMAPVELSAWVSPGAGPTPGRAQLSVRGELRFMGGLSLQWSARPGRGPSAGRISVPPPFPIAGPGATVQARERTLEHGCPAEAWVSANFDDGQGHALSERTLLGRYVLR